MSLEAGVDLAVGQDASEGPADGAGQLVDDAAIVLAGSGLVPGYPPEELIEVEQLRCRLARRGLGQALLEGQAAVVELLALGFADQEPIRRAGDDVQHGEFNRVDTGLARKVDHGFHVVVVEPADDVVDLDVRRSGLAVGQVLQHLAQAVEAVFRLVGVGPAVDLGRPGPNTDGEMIDAQLDELFGALLVHQGEVGVDEADHATLLDGAEHVHDLRVHEGLSASSQIDLPGAHPVQLVQQLHHLVVGDVLPLDIRGHDAITQQRRVAPTPNAIVIAVVGEVQLHQARPRVGVLAVQDAHKVEVVLHPRFQRQGPAALAQQ